MEKQHIVRQTIQTITTPGHGIMAADESTGTIGKRIIAAGFENTEAVRRSFRNTLYAHPQLGDHISGVILFHETFYQCNDSGVPFTKVLAEKGIAPGIKVDKGLQPLQDSPSEFHTTGLEDLRERCTKYFEDGARFCKWRAALKIDQQLGFPSDQAIETNAIELADYAKIALETGLVPLVEPEILIDGTHDIDVSAQVSAKVIAKCYEKLVEKGVDLSMTLLKPMMIMPGAACEKRAPAEEIARKTLQTMVQVVPASVPGIMFLSGGMSEEEATVNLNEVNRLARSGQQELCAPFFLSFSYGRALQSSVMKLWAAATKQNSSMNPAVDMALALARANSQAQLAMYQGPHPSQISGSLIENFRGIRTGEDPKGV